MGNNTITRKKRKRIWPIEIIAGLFIMMIVFFIAVFPYIASMVYVPALRFNGNLPIPLEFVCKV